MMIFEEEKGYSDPNHRQFSKGYIDNFQRIQHLKKLDLVMHVFDVFLETYLGKEIECKSVNEFSIN